MLSPSQSLIHYHGGYHAISSPQSQATGGYKGEHAAHTLRTHNIYVQYPIEVTECWANLTAGKDIADGVVSTVGDTLVSSLFKVIREAFIDDGVVAKDETTPSGLKPLRGELRSNELSKL